jgi:hypothetical protein
MNRLREVSRIRGWGVASTLATLLACGGGPTAPDQLDGTYVLASVDSKTIPADIGPLPPRPGSPDNDCDLLMASGHLDISKSAGTYLLRYELRDSCTQRSLGESGSSGSFKQTATRLELIADIGDVRLSLILVPSTVLTFLLAMTFTPMCSAASPDRCWPT